MSELIATTSRLVIRKIEDGDQDLVYNISREIPALESFQEDFEFLKSYIVKYAGTRQTALIYI